VPAVTLAIEQPTREGLRATSLVVWSETRRLQESSRCYICYCCRCRCRCRRISSIKRLAQALTMPQSVCQSQSLKRPVCLQASLALLLLSVFCSLQGAAGFTLQAPSRLESALHSSQTRGPQSVNDPFNSRLSPSRRRTWQDDIDDLVNPATSMADRQILLSKLLQANREIQDALQKAIQDRKVRYTYVYVYLNVCECIVCDVVLMLAS
jgi:hypothetical protein